MSHSGTENPQWREMSTFVGFLDYSFNHFPSLTSAKQLWAAELKCLWGSVGCMLIQSRCEDTLMRCCWSVQVTFELWACRGLQLATPRARTPECSCFTWSVLPSFFPLPAGLFDLLCRHRMVSFLRMMSWATLSTGKLIWWLLSDCGEAVQQSIVYFLKLSLPLDNLWVYSIMSVTKMTFKSQINLTQLYDSLVLVKATIGGGP